MSVLFQAHLADSFWQHLSWNWALLSMLGTLVVVIGLTAAILGRYIRIMLNILADTPPPLSMGPLDFQRLEGEPTAPACTACSSTAIATGLARA